MSDIFQSISSVLVPIGPHLTFLVVVLGITAWLFKDDIKEVIKSLGSKKNQDPVDPIVYDNNKKVFLHVDELTFDDLKDHDIFNVINEVRARLKFHEFENDPVKSKVFHDFIKIMLDEINEQLYTLIEEVKKEDSKPNGKRDGLKRVIMDRLNTIVVDYCQKTHAKFVSKGLSFQEAEYVVALFEEWRSETRIHIDGRINSIFASSFHQTNFARVLAVFELISVSISLISKDGLRSFETMNGRLKNLNYE
jgi:hypothetical protein